MDASEMIEMIIDAFVVALIERLQRILQLEQQASAFQRKVDESGRRVQELVAENKRLHLALVEQSGNLNQEQAEELDYKRIVGYPGYTK